MLQGLVTGRLAQANITIGGSASHHIQVLHPRVYPQVALLGSLGFGDAYIRGDLLCPDLYTVLHRWLEHREAHKLHRLDLGGKLSHRGAAESLPEYWLRFLCRTTDQQNPHRSRRVGQHYDLSPVMDPMLGPSQAYSCGFWGAGARNLYEAQCHKYRLIAKKLDIKKGDRVLEVGCGRGGLALFLAQEYGAHVVGITISKEQLSYGRGLCRNITGGGTVELRLMDYRDIRKEYPDVRFDHVVSVGMFEHVGPRHYGEFIRACYQALKPGGMLLLHTIVGNGGIDPFIWYRIFPGGVLPMDWQVTRSLRPYFKLCDVHEFGTDYARTLRAWRENFVKHWGEIKRSGSYDEKFFRMWEFYLTSCEAAFAVRRIQLVQVVASTGPLEETYRSIRPYFGSEEEEPAQEQQLRMVSSDRR